MVGTSVPRVDAHTLRLHGLSSKVNRPRAFWLARTEKEVAVQVATFISAGNAYRLQFPAVFNSPVPFNLQALSTMFDRYQESVAAQERLVSTQRATTGFKNAVFWGMGDGGNTMAGYPGLAAPRAVSGGFVPPTDAVHTGIVPCMIAMADLLVTQPGYEAETIGRRFGIVPTAGSGGSGEDPATLSPGGTARWTGSDVILTFRAPRGVAHGVERRETGVSCKRGTPVFLRGAQASSPVWALQTKPHEVCAKPEPAVQAGDPSHATRPFSETSVKGASRVAPCRPPPTAGSRTAGRRVHTGEDACAPPNAASPR